MNETPEGFGVDKLNGQTVLHPYSVVLLLTLGIAMLLLPRKYAVWPIIFMGCLVSNAQRFGIFSVNFTLLRALIIISTARIVIRGELSHFRPITLDWMMLAYSLSGVVIYFLQYQTIQALVFRLGGAYDMLGMYFAFRCFIRSIDDVYAITLGFIVISIPVAAAFFFEYVTGRNAFGFLGNVSEITIVREGRLRCQGAFTNPILAGCYWASVLPLIIARFFDPRKNRIVSIIGVGCSVAIVFFCSSSTPIMAIIFGLLAACLFPVRHRMRYVRWGIVGGIVILQMMLQRPIWFLIAKMNIVGGSTAWHRYHLLDEAVNHFHEWWLLGTKSTEHWGWGLWDVTNHYILEGVQGGGLTLFLFIAIIAMSFQYVGKMMQMSKCFATRSETILIWSLSVMMFMIATSFVSICFMGQITTLVWLNIATIASLSSSFGHRMQYRAGLQRRPVVTA